MTLGAGEAIAGYSIIGQVGAGGMATVYKAWHERLDRHVAIKLLHESFVRDADFLERFEREARIVARLEHPHIVPIYDYDEHNGVPYFVMKYIDGGTLKRRLIKQGITLDEILSTMTPLAAALTYAHEMGVLHRDIKPSNVMIDERDLPYLTDFGLARIAQVGDSTISHDMMLGTPFYISPEQAKGARDLTPATDVYAFGIVLYELLVGAVPFVAETPYAIVHEHIYTPPTPPSALNPELGAAVDAVLLRALAKQPEQRYQSASALMEEFKLALADSGVRQLPPDRLVAQPPPQSRNRPPLTPELTKENARDDLKEEAEQLRDLALRMRETLKRSQSQRKRKDPSPEEVIRKRVEKKFRARRSLMIHLGIFALVIGLIAVSIILQNRPGALQDLVMFASLWGIAPAVQAVRFHYKHGKGFDNRVEETEREITRQLQVFDLDTEAEMQIRQQIDRKYNARRALTIHGFIFALINSIWLFNMVYVPSYWFWGSSHLPGAGIWGVLLLVLFLRYYYKHGRGAEKQLAEIEGEITRQLRLAEMREEQRRRSLYDDDGAIYDLAGDDGRAVRLTDEGELTDSFIDELADADDRAQQRHSGE